MGFQRFGKTVSHDPRRPLTQTPGYRFATTNWAARKSMTPLCFGCRNTVASRLGILMLWLERYRLLSAPRCQCHRVPEPAARISSFAPNIAILVSFLPVGRSRALLLRVVLRSGLLRPQSLVASLQDIGFRRVIFQAKIREVSCSEALPQRCFQHFTVDVDAWDSVQKQPSACALFRFRLLFLPHARAWEPVRIYIFYPAVQLSQS